MISDKQKQEEVCSIIKDVLNRIPQLDARGEPDTSKCDESEKNTVEMLNTLAKVFHKGITTVPYTAIVLHKNNDRFLFLSCPGPFPKYGWGNNLSETIAQLNMVKTAFKTYLQVPEDANKIALCQNMIITKHGIVTQELEEKINQRNHNSLFWVGINKSRSILDIDNAISKNKGGREEFELFAITIVDRIMYGVNLVALNSFFDDKVIESLQYKGTKDPYHAMHVEAKALHYAAEKTTSEKTEPFTSINIGLATINTGLPGCCACCAAEFTTITAIDNISINRVRDFPQNFPTGQYEISLNMTSGLNKLLYFAKLLIQRAYSVDPILLSQYQDKLSAYQNELELSNLPSVKEKLSVAQFTLKSLQDNDTTIQSKLNVAADESTRLSQIQQKLEDEERNIQCLLRSAILVFGEKKEQQNQLNQEQNCSINIKNFIESKNGTSDWKGIRDYVTQNDKITFNKSLRPKLLNVNSENEKILIVTDFYIKKNIELVKQQNILVQELQTYKITIETLNTEMQGKKKESKDNSSKLTTEQATIDQLSKDLKKLKVEISKLQQNCQELTDIIKGLDILVDNNPHITEEIPENEEFHAETVPVASPVEQRNALINDPNTTSETSVENEFSFGDDTQALQACSEVSDVYEGSNGAAEIVILDNPDRELSGFAVAINSEG